MAAGHCPLDPAVAQQVVSALNQCAAPSTTITRLNPREIEVLILVAHGLTNREIAKTLVVSERAVGNHISTILNKLHIGNRTQAALYALRTGLTTLLEQTLFCTGLQASEQRHDQHMKLMVRASAFAVRLSGDWRQPGVMGGCH